MPKASLKAMKKISKKQILELYHDLASQKKDPRFELYGNLRSQDEVPTKEGVAL